MLGEGEREEEGGGRLLNASALRDPGPEGAAWAGAQVCVAGGSVLRGLTSCPSILGQVALAWPVPWGQAASVPGDLCNEKHF